MTLFRCITGEAFNEIMWDAARERSLTFQCNQKEQNYEEINKIGVNGCGNTIMAKAYFISFCMIGAFIFLNMFIAIILEGFDNVQQEEKMRINEIPI